MSRLGPDNGGLYHIGRVPLGQTEPSIIDGTTLGEIKELYRDVAHEMSGPVQYEKFNGATQSTSPYSESTQKLFLPPVSLIGIISVNPNEKQVTEMGLREMVDVIVKFSAQDLFDAGVTITTDDRLIVSGVEYNVYAINPGTIVQGVPVSIKVAGKVWSGLAPKMTE